MTFLMVEAAILLKQFELLRFIPLLANGELVILCIYHADFFFFSGVEAWDIGGVPDFRFSR
jgi:hypothetical protein